MEEEGVGLDQGSDPETDGLRRDASRAALRSDARGPQEPIPYEKLSSQTPACSATFPNKRYTICKL